MRLFSSQFKSPNCPSRVVSTHNRTTNLIVYVISTNVGKLSSFYTNHGYKYMMFMKKSKILGYEFSEAIVYPINNLPCYIMHLACQEWRTFSLAKSKVSQVPTNHYVTCGTSLQAYNYFGRRLRRCYGSW